MYMYIYIYSFSINVSDSIIVCEPKMTGWKWKPGTVANEKHSISEFDGLLFCYSIWLKFFFQINLSTVKQTKKIIFVFLFCIKNKSIFPVKELGEKKQASGLHVAHEIWRHLKSLYFHVFSQRLLSFSWWFQRLLFGGTWAFTTMPSKFFQFKCYRRTFIPRHPLKAKLRNDISHLEQGWGCMMMIWTTD